VELIRRLLQFADPGEFVLKKIAALICLALLEVIALFAQQNEFADLLVRNRYPLNVKDGRLSQSGAEVLAHALSGAQIVSIGEAHGTTQIPDFTAAVCGVLGPSGFHTIAIEAGSLVTRELQRWTHENDGRQRLIEFEKEFPDSIAFYNFQGENELLSHCAHSAQGGQFRLWGLDQEFFGTPSLILTRILETHPGKRAEAEARRLLERNNVARTKAEKTGSIGDLFMFSEMPDGFTRLKDLLRQEGNVVAQALMDKLIESHEIYQKNTRGLILESNRQRALLMKQSFMRNYQAATRAEGKPPKVLFKFGEWHLYKGFNPLHNNDIGNLAAELADSVGTESVHIAILGVKGTKLRYAGVGRLSPHGFGLDEDKDYVFLKPLFDNLIKDNWTMFDLRGMRKDLFSTGPVSNGMERLIFGYDFLVLFPNATASHPIR